MTKMPLSQEIIKILNLEVFPHLQRIDRYDCDKYNKWQNDIKKIQLDSGVTKRKIQKFKDITVAYMVWAGIPDRFNEIWAKATDRIKLKIGEALYDK